MLKVVIRAVLNIGCAENPVLQHCSQPHLLRISVSSNQRAAH